MMFSVLFEEGPRASQQGTVGIVPVLIDTVFDYGPIPYQFLAKTLKLYVTPASKYFAVYEVVFIPAACK